MLQVKSSLEILKSDDNMICCHFTSLRKMRRYAANELAFFLLNFLKEPQEKEFLLQKAISAGYAREDFNNVIASLEQEGIIYEIKAVETVQRLQKQSIFLQELFATSAEAEAAQKKLKKTVITVIGVGGIGSWIAHGLYQIGIGEMRLVDHDIVDASNLNRQLYTIADVGKHKVDALKERYPDCNIITYKEFLDGQLDLNYILKGSNLVINCADAPSVAATSELIATACHELNIQYTIGGGYAMHLGLVGPLFIPGKTACISCYLASQKKGNPFQGLEIVKEAATTGSISPLAAIVANLQLLEIFKFLIGRKPLNFNRFAEIDFLDFKLQWHAFEKDPCCERCKL